MMSEVRHGGGQRGAVGGAAYSWWQGRRSESEGLPESQRVQLWNVSEIFPPRRIINAFMALDHTDCVSPASWLW